MENDITIGTNFYLPDDIIAEILPRVPSVKSLLKFKCVSKWWLSFISSKAFIDAHLENSLKNLFAEQLIDVDQPDFSYLMTPSYATHIVGCCNGLCCIVVDQKEIILWNPSARKSHKLPTVFENVGKDDNEQCVQFAGFGYDESNNDYKVLATYRPIHSTFMFKSPRLFSLKTNSWKTIDVKFLVHRCVGHEGVLVNGKIHWAAEVSYLPFVLKIVSFDLGSNVQDFIELPWFESKDRSRLELGVIEGCLSVVLHKPDIGIEVWVMEVYGVKESWRKLTTIDGYEDVWPMCVSKEGEILFFEDFGDSLIIYIPRDESVRRLIINKFERIHKIGLYIPSLVSPFPDGGQNERPACM